MTSLQSKPAFREIEPHAAGFSQGFLVSGSMACRHASVYVCSDGTGDSDFNTAFDQLEGTLSRQGLSLAEIAAMTVMLARSEDIAKFRQVRVERLGGRNPASTVVIVEGFEEPERRAAIEIVAASHPVKQSPSNA